ncbi:MobC family plasmid mobilization relaxosome protein [Hymenobacter lutimineralis]|uniref:MobC family plasmid mobilization relaxosome protein n=2 Tax=Hymenobacter lutimineralis TaxID=2606448 RepID=A0A5D6UQA0_9BACT|nr:MobC family plasmid mobilization relaxosome protein [Hymenobacter lutimineralis]
MGGRGRNRTLRRGRGCSGVVRKMCFVHRASRNTQNPFARWAHYTCPFGDLPMADLPAPESTPHRPRKGGRKASPLAEKQRHVVSVRLTDAEHERLTQEAERYQLSQGEVLRSVWRKQNTATKLQAPPTPDEARQLAQLAGMAANLNQITKLAHLGQDQRTGATTVLGQMHQLLKRLTGEAS